ncbi:hypothetical protein [Pseudomonas sp. GM60]|uniref:hypothetical protein n=1 Tax=Pseudomonas sp. GM60 TaxID=1144334 RepID=UPI0002706E78|nr:hypothetical protein [Pseudomonas sp. GM60]EJM79596.1 hypothetical protein PMI32_04188 [Pseudomonas sp. GM60]
MSMQELITKEDLTPVNIASGLLDVIKDIELSIENASDHVSVIENRGWFKSTFSSAKTDLVSISKSQNKINDLMLGLIQEVITLNTMSYSFLAAVICELEERAKKGWTDGEGRFQELSETGQSFADKAQSIFRKIAEGSKSTQDRIELNKHNIDEVKSALSMKDALDAQQSQDIDRIKTALELKTERLASIDALLNQKSALDERQNHTIQTILLELQENGRVDLERAQIIERNSNDIEAIQSALSAKAEVISRQELHLGAVDTSLTQNAEQLACVSGQLSEQKMLGEKRDNAIRAILENLQTSSRSDQARDQAIGVLEQELLVFKERLAVQENSFARYSSRTNRLLATLAGSTLVLATTLVLRGLSVI